MVKMLKMCSCRNQQKEMTSQGTKMQREETGRPSWTSCCPVWDTPWVWETSGDSRTSVTETEEVKFIFDRDLTEKHKCKNLKSFDSLFKLYFICIAFIRGLLHPILHCACLSGNSHLPARIGHWSVLKFRSIHLLEVLPYFHR